METSIDGRCFDVRFVGMMPDDDMRMPDDDMRMPDDDMRMPDDDMRMPDDDMNEIEAMDWSAYHRCVIVYP